MEHLRPAGRPDAWQLLTARHGAVHARTHTTDS